MLIAEELMALCWDEGSRRPHRACTRLDVGIGAALLVELVEQQAVVIEKGGWLSGRTVVAGPVRPSDPLLQRAQQALRDRWFTVNLAAAVRVLAARK